MAISIIRADYEGVNYRVEPDEPTVYCYGEVVCDNCGLIENYTGSGWNDDEALENLVQVANMEHPECDPDEVAQYHRLVVDLSRPRALYWCRKCRGEWSNLRAAIESKCERVLRV